MCIEFDTDFCKFNFEYFLKLRELAIREPEMVPLYLGVDADFIAQIAQLESESFLMLSQIKQPLVMPLAHDWWWQRLFMALRSGRNEEVALVLEQVSLITSQVKGGA